MSNTDPKTDTPRATSRVKTVMIALAAVGAILLLGELNILVPHGLFGSITRYWPCVIIGAGAVKLLYEPRNVPAGIVMLLAGVFVQAIVLDWLPASFHQYWSVGFLLWGLWLLFVPPREKKTAVDADLLDISEHLAGRSYAVRTQNLLGGKVSATIASIDLDLTGAATAQSQVVLAFDVLLSGIDLYLPDNWRVRIDASRTLSRMGDGRRIPAEVADGPEVVLTGPVTLAAIAVKRRRKTGR